MSFCLLIDMLDIAMQVHKKVCIKCLASVLPTESFNNVFWAKHRNHEHIGDT